jgi:hypothetical protein
MGLLPVMLSQGDFIATLVVVFLAGEYDIADCQRKGIQSARFKWEKWECSNCKVALSHRCSGSGSNRSFRSVYRSSDPRIKQKTFGVICSLSVIRIILLAKNQVRFLLVHSLLAHHLIPFYRNRATTSQKLQA